MSNSFVIWQYKSVAGACVLKQLEGIEDQFRLRNGTSLQSEFPTNVLYRMHPDFPNDLLLVDNLLNSKMIIVASEKLKNEIESFHMPKVEYLKIGILDHKNRIASDSYHIIHPIDPVDCIDRSQSIFEEDLIDPESIDSFKRLVIDETQVPSDRQIFRLKGFWDITLVRRKLAETLTDKGFSGLDWLEIPDYPKK
ncbi:hypothetical protein A1359_08690 [Methylomonas lenta]|uniref:Immunity MXAN-0049 protein domain-containing protein n=1 Tax=Methylomonas lenta TaxID=980561 RepID=A0A177NEP1_9GAMM|nr:DUF1629 domain-containing protein [Methylomonas lenta]OAI16084.1 hypothetical protein A1359_08690 [Methylomonas lenta]